MLDITVICFFSYRFISSSMEKPLPLCSAAVGMSRQEAGCLLAVAVVPR